MSDKLAIEGGPKAVRNKLTPWPQFDEKAIKAVEEVLRSGKVNYWTGKRGMEFEKNTPSGRAASTPASPPAPRHCMCRSPRWASGRAMSDRAELHFHRQQLFHRAGRRSGFPFKSAAYADPKSVDYTNVEVPNAW